MPTNDDERAEEKLVKLSILAKEAKIPLRTLQVAAKQGRLPATLEQTDLGPVWKSTLAEVLRFKGTYTPHKKSIKK